MRLELYSNSSRVTASNLYVKTVKDRIIVVDVKYSLGVKGLNGFTMLYYFTYAM